MALLSKRQIFDADDRKFEDVQCPEWGGDVRVRGLTAYEQSVISRLVFEDKKSEVALKIVQFGCIDAEGEPLFTRDDLNELKKKSFTVIERLTERISKLTGTGSEEEIEAARKN